MKYKIVMVYSSRSNLKMENESPFVKYTQPLKITVNTIGSEHLEPRQCPLFK